ncbi:MAG: Gfo/Idh/MocA family oxidoreductase [Acidobacteriota bacterium]|nr:Gfo/Idh/MocA family oxidoreductase [Acidobacteriota bacterium]
MSRSASLTRRDFVKTAMAGALAAPSVLAGSTAFPAIFPSRVVSGRVRPGDTLAFGCIGVGRQGTGDMKELIYRGLEAGARVVAVCDVDSHRRDNAQWEAEKIYSAELGTDYKGLDIYADFRELLARPDIDGVLIVTPDHWHACHAVAAVEAGKDVYLEKPMTFTIAEGRKLIEAVRRNKRILQVGSQQRSSVYFRLAAEAVRNGRIGKLRTITALLPVDQGTGDPKPVPVPRFLNYDAWQGPAEEMPYAVDRVHPMNSLERPGWLQNSRYTRGMITGWGSHMVDSAQWGHGTDETGPVTIEAKGDFPDRGLFDVHTTFKGEAVFADGVRMRIESGEAGVRFEGDSGWVYADRGKVEASKPEILRAKPGADEIKLPVSGNHMKDFLEAVRTRRDPIAPVEVGHRSNTICLLTHIAMKLGRKLRWDPAAEKFIDDAEADRMLDFPHRAPWTL